MVDFEGAGDHSDDDGQDDIARFEQQCIARAQAEGLHLVSEDYDPPSDEDGDMIIKSKLAAQQGPEPVTIGDWQRKCTVLQEKLARREAEAGQLKSNLEMLRTDVPAGGDVNSELKAKLIELTKKNRRLQVSVETHKGRAMQLEAEAKKPREEIRKQAEELAAQQLGDNGLEDWKQKYLLASNKLQEARHEMQEIRVQLQRHKKVVLKELGTDEAVEKALAVVDDPADTQWRGRAAQIAQLKRQVQELREQLKRGSTDADGSCDGLTEAPPPGDTPQRGRRKLDQPSDKEKASLAQAAEKRREEFERLQEEVERLRSEQTDSKRKREALKSRSGVLEGQVKELKAHVLTLVSKSENDDELVAALRKQLGRPALPSQGSPSLGAEAEMEALRRENSELAAQLDKQSHVVFQLRQRNLAASCENGSVKLGPRSAEGSVSDRQLVERVRYLEAENARHVEQVRLLRDKLGEESRPGSGISAAVGLQE
mmetsp:Transcript_31406/g.73307  ORF Transcript_31406/g.73307 Transcript_31406/m.73307 type:complete len:484 (+) Transcript_31406:44-1495(+)